MKREDFLKAIEAADADPQHRLIYADWLDENNEPDEASRQRALAAQECYRAVWLSFPKASEGGRGGWSRRAKHRPQPERVEVRTRDVCFRGKSVIVNGIRRLKLNLFHADGRLVRLDYVELEARRTGEPDTRSGEG